MLKSFAPVILTMLFAALLGAQQSPSSSYAGTTQSPSIDCSDPLQVDSQQCQNQNGQFPGTSGTSTQFPGARPNTSVSPGSLGPSRGGLPPTYSDAESQARRISTEGSSQQVPLPPGPLTEFQKFIASTTGQVLPIYGENLFRSVPSTFAPVDMAPVPPDYVIGPGDELRIRVWGQVNFQANVRVDRAGEVYIPVSQVGPVHVAGIAYSELNDRIRQAISRVYRNFDVVADIGRIRAIQIYLAGQARRPGVYTVSSLSTLIDAVFASGGPSVQGSLRHIQLRRGAEMIADLDLYGFLIRGDKSKDVKLLAGDIIFIPPVGPQVAIAGSVRNPAIYELHNNETLADLITDAGGLSATASQSRVSIERIQKSRERIAMEVGFDQDGLSTVLEDGDLVRAFPIAPKFTQSVTLRGNVANPGHFAWHPGMRLSELIPDKESLVTRDYWWRRVQLGLPAPEFEPFPGFSNMRQPDNNEPSSIRNQITAQLDRGINLEQPNAQNRNSQMLSAEQSPSSSSLAAQQAAPEVPLGAEHGEISRPKPEIDWDYANILRFDKSSLKTDVIPFDLGKLVLDHDATQDLELQAGDIVSIFSEADIRLPIARQTKFVKLEGEFLHSGLYSVHPGETLQELVSRAGGLTPNAYLFGAEFTRESTRVLQQARIDEYVQSLNLRIQRSNLALSASPVSNAQDMASAAAAQASERELVSRLRQMRASGRVVLEFKPDSTGIGVVPALVLEDGDRFVVPSRPATVNIVGAVNDQNSFLYSSDRTVGIYLKKAGGATKDADMKRAFVIRADGEVVGYSSTKNAWGSSFNNLRMFPGDTIVIPEKTFKPSAMRGVLEWSQMFSQFALGAASIAVIAP
jgi:protein involved in polysaccharide export with SLBB domain